MGKASLQGTVNVAESNLDVRRTGKEWLLLGLDSFCELVGDSLVAFDEAAPTQANLHPHKQNCSEVLVRNCCQQD